MDSAKHMASVWQQGSAFFIKPELTSTYYYGKRGTPLTVIEDGNYQLISRADRLKASFYWNDL